MSKKERQTGHGAGPVTIGSVVVPGRWRYSYVQEPELPGNGRSEEDFKFVVTLALADRKKLVHLKRGDWTVVTAGPFSEMPVYLNEIDYNNGALKVALTFLKTQPLSINSNAGPA